MRAVKTRYYINWGVHAYGDHLTYIIKSAMMLENQCEVSKMTTAHVLPGTRIPRLQEISFLPITMLGVADGIGFEGIRQRLVSHMIDMRESSPSDRQHRALSAPPGAIQRGTSAT